MNRTVLAIAELVTGLAGFILLWNAMGWKVALAVFLLMMSNNFGRAYREQQSSGDSAHG
jgi:hypothetical protein